MNIHGKWQPDKFLFGMLLSHIHILSSKVFKEFIINVKKIYFIDDAYGTVHWIVLDGFHYFKLNISPHLS
jgi:hypothetical protein